MPKYVDIFSDATKFDKKVRFEDCSGVCITDQEAICTVTEIMAKCNGDLAVARDKFNNHLLFESALGGVLVDSLNEKEVAEYRKREEEFKINQQKAEEEKLLFEQYKAEIAKKASTTPPSDIPSE